MKYVLFVEKVTDNVNKLADLFKRKTLSFIYVTLTDIHAVIEKHLLEF